MFASILFKGVVMPLFNGPIACFVRKHKLVRRTALLGGVWLVFTSSALGRGGGTDFYFKET